MRTFLFQCSILMMVILVYSSSPIHSGNNKDVCKMLLGQIKKEALSLIKNIEMEALNSSSKELEKKLPKISHNDQTCVPHFLCLAEKVVQNITDKPAKDKLSHLHQYLVQYNIQTQETNCTVTPSGAYSLRSFLDNVKKCVTFTLFMKTSP